MAWIKTIEEYQEEVNTVYGEGEWTVLSYEGTSNKVLIRHKCGTERTVSRAKNFLKGDIKCKTCNKVKVGRPRLSFEKMKEKVYRETDGEYELVSMKSSSELEIIHMKCDRPSFITTSYRFFTKGQRCQCTKKGRVGKKAK